MSRSIEGDGSVQQISPRRSLYLDHDMVPGIIFRPTGDSGRNPLLVYVVVDVPFVTASNAAFMSPDE